MKAVSEMSRGKIGMTAVVDRSRRVRGILTDGDVRRAIENGVGFKNNTVEMLMTPNAKTIRPDALAVEAVQVMENRKISQLLVVDGHEKLVGALNMHDLFRARVI